MIVFLLFVPLPHPSVLQILSSASCKGLLNWAGGDLCSPEARAVGREDLGKVTLDSLRIAVYRAGWGFNCWALSFRVRTSELEVGVRGWDKRSFLRVTQDVSLNRYSGIHNHLVVVLLYSPGFSRTCHPPALASQVLGL
jgi:hypothetical protein